MKDPKTFSFWKYGALILGIFLSSALSASAARNIDVIAILDKVSTFFLNVIISVGLLMVLVGAFLFTTSGGDTQKVEKGKQAIIWGLAGVAIALLAKAIVHWTTQLIG